MTRTVLLVINVDTTEYESTPDTDEGAVDLVNAMLNGAADLPYESCVITCGAVNKIAFEL